MKYDAIIIGGGHNGLVTAAFLAKSGCKVLVLEKRATLGGLAATEEIFPGFRVNTGAQDAGMFLPEIVDQLSLQKHGLEFIESPTAVFAPQPDGTSLTLWHSLAKNIEEIRRFSDSDADRFDAFQSQVYRHLDVLKSLMTLTPPDLKGGTFFDFLQWARVGLKFKRSARRELVELLRVIPMSVRQFLDEWFESEVLKAALGAAGVIGNMQGPFSPGSTLSMLYQAVGSRGGFRAGRFVQGGVGRLSEALASAARNHRAEIRTEAEVLSIRVVDDKALAVTLADKTEIEAQAIISSADPNVTFLKLVGPQNLGPQFVRKVRNIRFRGCTAAVHLVLRQLPQFRGEVSPSQLTGHIQICPSLDYLERAYDEAKYGRISKHPFMDIVIPTVLDSSLAPAGQHIMSITMQYAPYHLREGNWDEQGEILVETVIETLSKYAPNLKEVIANHHVITPLDWEHNYGFTQGCIFQGQMALDQLLCMRPVPGFGRYRTPIGHLYLCGAGTHPGGGLTGAPGFNAAREVLKDLR